MSVIVQLRGGLGNQLFQYAAGYTVAQRTGAELLLDTALLPAATVDIGGVRRWPEQLSGFAHSGRFVDGSKGSAVRKRVMQSLAGRERALGDSRGGFALGRGVYAHETREDPAAFAALTGSSRINSYCTDPAMFAGVADELAQQVRSLRSPGSWYTDQVAAIEAERPIALHVRWGDYLTLSHVFGEVSADYYRRALALLAREHGSERPVWLFSDDPEGAAAFLGPHLPIARAVAAPAESTALENLLLLSHADAFVCANSTFSWWAAFLSRAAAGSVVFPRPLFAVTGPPEPKNWLSPDWIQLGRD